MPSAAMTSSTLVIQSCSETQLEGWMGQCIGSVQGWADAQGFDYHFVGDEIFRLVPDWYMAKVGRKLPVATDLARLKMIQMALQEGYTQAIWLDADVLVFDRSLQIDFDGSCAFGQEVWVQEHEGRLAARRNVHNAISVFRKDCVVLPFLMQTVESIIRRVHPEHVAPQMVGPKLLTALHSICGFALLPEVGALSPEVVSDICAGKGAALDLMRRKSEIKPKAVNLCASLIQPEAAVSVIETLLPSVQ
jgi:hypothetical protein